LDGYRLQLRINNGKVNCYTRRGYGWATRFPTLVSAAQKLNIEAAIIDGEVVVVAENGDTDFAALESYVASKSPGRSAGNLVFYAFDLLYISPLDRSRSRAAAAADPHEPGGGPPLKTHSAGAADANRLGHSSPRSAQRP
jgi:bifunctional non-homologous end joining protein LigD